MGENSYIEAIFQVFNLFNRANYFPPQGNALSGFLRGIQAGGRGPADGAGASDPLLGESRRAALPEPPTQEVKAMKITRRNFVRLCGGTAAVVLPFGLTRCARPRRPAHDLIDDVEWKKSLADAALRVANSRGAAFADVRVVRNLIQTLVADDQQVKGVGGEWHYGASPEHVLEKVDIGFNVRVLKDGAWGFVASPVLSEDEAAAVAGLACDLAEKAARTLPQPIRLVPEPAHVDTWETPHEEDPFMVPVEEKVALLLRINEEVRKNPQIDRAFSWLDFWDENKFYANSDGASIQQRLVRSDGSFFARAEVDGVRAQRRFFVNPLTSATSTSAGSGFRITQSGSPPRRWKKRRRRSSPARARWMWSWIRRTSVSSNTRRWAIRPN